MRRIKTSGRLLAVIKVYNKYEYKSSPLLLPLTIHLRNPNQHILEEALMLKQVLKQVIK